MCVAKRCVTCHPATNNVVDYAAKLATLYNTLSRLNIGSVLHIKSKDAKVFCVVLQGVVFAP